MQKSHKNCINKILWQEQKYARKVKNAQLQWYL